MTQFGKKLRELRSERNLTQIRMAELMGLDPRVYNRWERSDTTPHFETIIKIADLLQVSLDELAGREEKKQEVKIHNHELKMLYEQVDKLTDKEQDAVFILLDSLVKKHHAAKVLAS